MMIMSKIMNNIVELMVKYSRIFMELICKIRKCDEHFIDGMLVYS